MDDMTRLLDMRERRHKVKKWASGLNLMAGQKINGAVFEAVRAHVFMGRRRTDRGSRQTQTFAEKGTSFRFLEVTLDELPGTNMVKVTAIFAPNFPVLQKELADVSTVSMDFDFAMEIFSGFEEWTRVAEIEAELFGRTTGGSEHIDEPKESANPDESWGAW